MGFNWAFKGLKWRKANWIGHILCRHCLLKHVIEGELDVTRRCRRSRHKKLLDHPKEMRRYWDLKEEAPYRTLWRTHFGRGYGAVVRQAT